MASEIKINNINLYGSSSLDIYDDKCGICREHIEEICIKCKSTGKKEECYSVIGGICNHSYHFHCIDAWIKTANYVSRNCPTCNQKWEMKKRPMSKNFK